MSQDKIRVLRDAYELHRVGTDYSETETWEPPVVDGLVADGLLEVSVIGRILGIRSYRPTPSGLSVAKECSHAFAGDVGVMRLGAGLPHARV